MTMLSIPQFTGAPATAIRKWSIPLSRPSRRCSRSCSNATPRRAGWVNRTLSATRSNGCCSTSRASSSGRRYPCKVAGTRVYTKSFYFRHLRGSRDKGLSLSDRPCRDRPERSWLTPIGREAAVTKVSERSAAYRLCPPNTGLSATSDKRDIWRKAVKGRKIVLG